MASTGPAYLSFIEDIHLVSEPNSCSQQMAHPAVIEALDSDVLSKCIKKRCGVVGDQQCWVISPNHQARPAQVLQKDMQMRVLWQKECVKSKCIMYMGVFSLSLYSTDHGFIMLWPIQQQLLRQSFLRGLAWCQGPDVTSVL